MKNWIIVGGVVVLICVVAGFIVISEKKPEPEHQTVSANKSTVDYCPDSSLIPK